MKVITLTTSNRPQQNTLVNDTFKVHKCSTEAITIVVPFQDLAKDMFLTFSRQEVCDMLAAIEQHVKDHTSLI